jgi:hypothetical protein
MVQTICARLSMGEPLAVICRDIDVHPGTVRDWMAKDQSIADLVAWARVDGFDVLAAKVLELASSPVQGFVEEYERREKPRPADAGEDYQPEFEMVLVKRRGEDMLGHRRLQIDTILKLLAKWDPKRYGDKLQLADSDGNQLPPATFVIQPVQPAPRTDE